MGTNYLDMDGIRGIASALKDNKESIVDTWRCSNQKGMGSYFGRAVEKAVAEMMQTNDRVTKLGFNCEDPHWRDVIGRAIIKNNDLARRRRKKERDGGEEVEEVEVKKAVDKTMS